MSPGCATRVVAADGTRAFVKAVGTDLNPMTPGMFRTEITVLGHIGASPLWARLLASYDAPTDGAEWVALLLEDVAGRPPDLSLTGEATAFLDGVDALGGRLGLVGDGLGLPEVAATIARWQEVWPAVAELDGVLPGWTTRDAEEHARRHAVLLEHAAPDRLVHGDIRQDNTIVRADSSVVFVDWGGARRGPSWFDPLLARLEWVEQPLFDELVRGSPALRELGDELVTAFLAAFGAWLGYRTTVARDVNLPTLNEFRRAESARLLEGARRRLSRRAGLTG